MAGPGRRVGQGHLRVDTARAVQKLRTYQLADPTAWVLEVVRAAVMVGATEIEASGDANDVTLSWREGTLDDDEMRGVLDALVNPGDSERGVALRRLKEDAEIVPNTGDLLVIGSVRRFGDLESSAIARFGLFRPILVDPEVPDVV